MVTFDISIEDISRLMGFDHRLTVDELDNHLAFTIGEVDSEPEGPDENGHTKVAVEIKTSNRPDLWSAEGIARMIRSKSSSPGLPPLKCDPSGFEIDVDPRVKEIRPYISASIVRGLKLDDFLIKQIIQLQDKIDFSFGRKRKRTSIGIYNINMIESPIHYTVVDRSFKFIPLQFEEELTVNEIFNQHPKGLEYQNILSKHKQVPMLFDKNTRVLSMPPIINSNDVGRVTIETTDVLVEVTGTNRDAVNAALSIVTQALRDRGGKVSTVKINYPDEYEIQDELTPLQDPIETSVNYKLINNYLGTKFTKKRMVQLLRTRCNDARIDGENIIVSSPPWRNDIIHWVDISEEVAMGAEYNSLEPTSVKVVTAGKLLPSTEDENMIRQLMIGMGLIEVLNYNLIDHETITSKVNRSMNWLKKNCIEILNPVSSSRSVLRPDLLSGLIRFTSRNTHVEYPHHVFETGEITVKQNTTVITKTSLAVVLSGNDETFETILRMIDALTRLIGVKYELTETNTNFYLSGRSANIVIENKVAGQVGEIDPIILNNYGIEMPTSAFEIDLSTISSLNCPIYPSD